MLFRITHNYLGYHLGYVLASNPHDAICSFAEKTEMAIAALVATPYPVKEADLSNISLKQALL